MIAREMQLNRLVLEVDSQALVRLLLEDPGSSNLDYYLLMQCRTLLLKDDWEVHLEDVYREANEAANWFANDSFNATNVFTVFDSPSLSVHKILYDDLVGHTCPDSYDFYLNNGFALLRTKKMVNLSFRSYFCRVYFQYVLHLR